MIEKVDQLQRDVGRFKHMLSSDEEESSEDEPPAKQRRTQVAFTPPSNPRNTPSSSQSEKKRKSRSTVSQLITVEHIDLDIDEAEIERLAGESQFVPSRDAF